MKIRFNEFLKEYGGPGRTIGFRYSDPNIDYTFTIHVVINPELESSHVKNTIKNIFKKHNVGEESIDLTYLGGDEYKLIIKIKGYSKYEMVSMFNLLIKNVYKKLGDDVIFLTDSIDLQGKDVDIKKRPIGFKPNIEEDDEEND